MVITGGASLLPGLTKMAEKMFGQPVRIGYPQGVRGLEDIVRNPMYATGVGLLLFSGNKKSGGQFEGNGNGDSNFFHAFVHKMRRWLLEVF